jgi:hypothetical protein
MEATPSHGQRAAPDFRERQHTRKLVALHGDEVVRAVAEYVLDDLPPAEPVEERSVGRLSTKRFHAGRSASAKARTVRGPALFACESGRLGPCDHTALPSKEDAVDAVPPEVGEQAPKARRGPLEIEVVTEARS